jgi:RNA 2',3'-cyclic 3'-phosphodiesterase
MRLFIALDIDDGIRERIARFVDGVRGFAPAARWVHPESLHVTLKFIGEKPEPAVVEIKQALGTIAARTIEIHFRGYGFFPTAKAPRVFWVGIEAGSELPALAAAVDETISHLGITREEHAFNPHLTLARGGDRRAEGSGSPKWRKGDGLNRSFQHLQEKLGALPAPDFGTMAAREFFLYQSQLSPKGSKYTKLAGFGLR